eukprot:scaffold5382_cov16-Prasinocladus_malaysianus.AAC.1
MQCARYANRRLREHRLSARDQQKTGHARLTIELTRQHNAQPADVRLYNFDFRTILSTDKGD